MQGQKLSKKIKAGYGVCDFGGNLFFTVIAFLLLNYLTDTVGLAAGLAGIVVAVGKIWDAITDPMVGYLSDRTGSKMGRRRPYMLYGSFPLFITMVIMFTNPRLSSQGMLFIWALVVYCLLCTAYTLVNIPYNSLTPELTQDYHERTSLNGYRFGFAVFGTLLGAGAALPIINAFASKNTGFTVMGTIFGAVMMITALITVVSIREPDIKREKLEEGFFSTYLKVFKNKPYVLVLLTYTLHITALTVISGIAIYYFKYIHNAETQTTIAMLVLLGTAMVFIPLSVVIAKKTGKKTVYGIGMLIIVFSLMILFFFGHTRPINFSFFIMFVMGIGMGFTYVMPWAMVPDAVEYDYLMTGERKEGAFYGIWTFGIKIGQAVALAISGGVLSLTGYIPDVPQTALAELGIRLLIGPIGAVIFLLAVVMLYFYPITEKRYNEILSRIKDMEAGKA